MRRLQDVVAEVPAVRLLLEALVAQPLLVAGNLVAADERRSRWSQPTSAPLIFDQQVAKVSGSFLEIYE